MISNFEKRDFIGNTKVWTGKYLDLRNLSHWHMECELIHSAKGNLHITSSGKSYELAAGQAYLCSGKDIHSILSEPGAVCDILLFDPSIAAGIADIYRLKNPVIANPVDISDVLFEIRKEAREKSNFFEVKINSTVCGLVADIFRNQEYEEIKKHSPESSVSMFNLLIEKIDGEYPFISFSDSAQLMGMSEGYFSRFFHNMSGMTFSKYLNTVRIGKSIGILLDKESGKTITQVASECGYDTIRNFNRVFKDITGMTPRDARNRRVFEKIGSKYSYTGFDPTSEGSMLLDDWYQK